MTAKMGKSFILFILTIGLAIASNDRDFILNGNVGHHAISRIHDSGTNIIADRMKDGARVSAIEMETSRKTGMTATAEQTTTNPTESNDDEEIFECGSPENLHKGNFSFYDYAVVCGMLIISLGIGVFYGFFNKSGTSSSEFLLGSEMTIFPVTLSLTTSFITAIELLGNPAEIYYHGTQFTLILVPMIFVIPVAVKVFYPIYFKLELTSCYEYLGIRFGKDIRIFGAILYIIQMSFYTAVAVLAPAIALSKATGLNTRLAVVLIYLVCIFYASQGGMKAVVIADTFQAAVLLVSLVLILGLGYFYTGGFQEVFKTASEHERLEIFNTDPSPLARHTVFSIIIGGFFYWTSLFCTNQASVQKCMSLKSLKSARIALGFAIMGLIFVFMINFYTGLMVFTHYKDCDPLKAGEIEAKDQLLPFYVLNVFESINSVTGIFVAGIFAASLGTVASALNSLAAVTCEDLLINGFNVKIHPEKGATYAKWMSLGYGIFSFVLVFVVERLGGILQATLTLNGLLGGVTLGLFLLGILFKKANAKGALLGGIIALVLVVYVGVMAQITSVDPEPLPLSLEKCNCFVNTTLTTSSWPSTSSSEGMLTLPNSDVFMTIVDNARNDHTIMDQNTGFSFSSIFKISYMWYSMLGAMLTILLGIVISIIADIISQYRIAKITKKQRKASAILNGIVVVDSEQNRTNLDENMESKHIPKPKWYPSMRKCGSGHDNVVLKIDDEK